DLLACRPIVPSLSPQGVGERGTHCSRKAAGANRHICGVAYFVYASPTANPVGAWITELRKDAACRDPRVILLFSSTGALRWSVPANVVPGPAVAVPAAAPPPT